MKRLFLLCFMYLIFSSHELFLKTENYYLNPNQTTELFLFNGSFDNSENVITRDRIVDAKIIAANDVIAPATSDYYDKGETTFLKFETKDPGTYVAGISTLPRMIDLSAEDFKDYLIHEGLLDMADERKEKGIEDQAAREKYSKHVKCILQVGDSRTEHYSSALGYPIEFVPMSNPYALASGGALPCQLLVRGKPLQNIAVRSGYKKDGKLHSNEMVRTDENGICQIPISSTGLWYVATIHMEESDEGEVDYESNWATLTFEIK